MSEAFFEVPIGEEILELNRDNTTVFRHLGTAALFDHVFMTTDDNRGGYIWRTHPQYEEIDGLAEANDCILHLNLPEVSDVDYKNYVDHHMSDLDEIDDVVEDWRDGSEG